MANIILGLFYLLFPALALYACEKNSIFDAIGAAVLCYGMGIAVSLTGIIPAEAGKLQETFMNITVPLAIPLMLFSIDLKQWSRLAGKTFVSFLLTIVSVLAASGIAFLFLRDSVDESWKVSGMLIGMYTGGTPNLNAIGLALKVKEHILVLTNTADMIFSIPWFIFNLTVAQRIFNKFLPAFQSEASTAPDAETRALKEIEGERTDFNRFAGIFERKTFPPLLGAFGISVLIFAAGAGVFMLAPQAYNMAALMLTITSLGLACSFIPAVRNIRMSFQLGMYIILVFCLVVGSMADLKQLLTAAPSIILFTLITMYGAWGLHVFLARFFKIDADTVIITSVAAIYSPPFVPIAAAALKNKEAVVSGLAAGIMGYAVGNYLGITFGYLLKAFF